MKSPLDQVTEAMLDVSRTMPEVRELPMGEKLRAIRRAAKQFLTDIGENVTEASKDTDPLFTHRPAAREALSNKQSPQLADNTDAKPQKANDA